MLSVYMFLFPCTSCQDNVQHIHQMNSCSTFKSLKIMIFIFSWRFCVHGGRLVSRKQGPPPASPARLSLLHSTSFSLLSFCLALILLKSVSAPFLCFLVSSLTIFFFNLSFSLVHPFSFRHFHLFCWLATSFFQQDF